MSKFRTMTLKSEHEYPSPLASTSSITLEDPLSRSPSTVKVEGVINNNHIEGDPVNPRRPSSPVPDSRTFMNDDDNYDQPKPEYPPLTLKSEPRTSSTSTSASASPRTGSTTPSVSVPTTKPLKKKGPQLIGELPIATEEAMKTFVQIEENHYQYSTLGRSREALESMTCECPPNGRGTLRQHTHTLCCIH